VRYHGVLAPNAEFRRLGRAESFGVDGRFIGVGLYGFPLLSSLQLHRFIGAYFLPWM